MDESRRAELHELARASREPCGLMVPMIGVAALPDAEAVIAEQPKRS